MTKNNKSPKTETITLRIEKEILDKIRTYAESNNITINAAANQMLTHAVDWSIPAAQAGWIPIPKNILISIIDNLNDKTIQQVASKVGKTVPEDMLLIMEGEMGIKQWISVLRNRALAAGFSYQEKESSKKIKIMTKHDMGMKWSLWFKAFYQSYFDKLECPVKFTLTKNTIAYEIPKDVITV